MAVSIIIRIFALSIRNKSNIQNSKQMATNEEWWEYFKNLQEQLKKIQDSNLPSDVKEELTDKILEKISIVKKYFLE